MIHRKTCHVVIAFFLFTALETVDADDRPNIILVMADDQGWAQTSYYNHPVLKTPNLDAMAESGLRFDRFYAGAPVCSPTRASVLTGRGNDRTGVNSHGYALRRQEITLPQLLRDAGYVTGHFGKWHLNGLRGPGVPILHTDDHNPGEFGFDAWLSVTNFFDRDPIMSRNGKFEEFQGDSSEIIVDQALDFIARQKRANRLSFTVIWYGTPHSPFKAHEDDMVTFKNLDEKSRNHYGELVAMDRSIGTLRKQLRDLDLAENTLVWFCSDNGGLKEITPSSVGPLRGNKSTIFEGGLRVPGIIEWPKGIKRSRVTSYPAGVVDILPTILDIATVKYTSDRPLDGVSLTPLFKKELGRRESPIAFRHLTRAAIVDNQYKLLTQNLQKGPFELYDLVNDESESKNIADEKPEIAAELKKQLMAWNESVNISVEGRDYPEQRVDPNEPSPRFWTEVEEYQQYFDDWRNRWEYESRLKPKQPKRSKRPQSTGKKN